jgi:hypothetical protein
MASRGWRWRRNLGSSVALFDNFDFETGLVLERVPFGDVFGRPCAGVGTLTYALVIVAGNCINLYSPLPLQNHLSPLVCAQYPGRRGSCTYGIELAAGLERRYASSALYWQCGPCRELVLSTFVRVREHQGDQVEKGEERDPIQRYQLPSECPLMALL